MYGAVAPPPPVVAEHAPLPPMTLLRRGPWADEPLEQPEVATVAAAVEAPAPAPWPPDPPSGRSPVAVAAVA
eukprot:4538274-Lingulodinium_polyedra.AAC.1